MSRNPVLALNHCKGRIPVQVGHAYSTVTAAEIDSEELALFSSRWYVLDVGGELPGTVVCKAIFFSFLKERQKRIIFHVSLF